MTFLVQTSLTCLPCIAIFFSLLYLTVQPDAFKEFINMFYSFFNFISYGLLKCDSDNSNDNGNGNGTQKSRQRQWSVFQNRSFSDSDKCGSGVDVKGHLEVVLTIVGLLSMNLCVSLPSVFL